MTISIAHLGPAGTYSEAAALAYAHRLGALLQQACPLCPYPSIAQTLQAVDRQESQLGVVPMENSIGGTVVVTLDMLWQLDSLQIQQALILPISHALLSHAETLATIKTVYSHPQALAQCQVWLETHLPKLKLIPTNSTTEALQQLDGDATIGAIASKRAAELYDVPILAHPINDHPDNCTRFWVVRRREFELNRDRLSGDPRYVSIAFSLPENAPGALLHPLQVLAQRGINMSRIESRPTKRSLGEYLFFVDLEARGDRRNWETALEELRAYTEVLKIWGEYDVWPVQDS